MTISIQPLPHSEADTLKPMIEELADFHNTLNEQFSTFYPVIEINETMKQIKKALEENELFILGAYQDKELLGFIELTFSENAAKINRLFVNSLYRNHHIGKQLMNQALNFLKTKSIDSVDLTVVQENLQAKKFYENFAFEERAVIMTKKLK